MLCLCCVYHEVCRSLLERRRPLIATDWRCDSNLRDERHIVSLFADDPRAPYSIHKFVEYGAEACGTHPGQWFGPSATARCIQCVAPCLCFAVLSDLTNSRPGVSRTSTTLLACAYILPVMVQMSIKMTLWPSRNQMASSSILH